MPERINIGLLLAIIISLVDEAIIIAVLFFVLSQFGIEMPIWFMITLVLIFSIITYVVYRALKKAPLLGFDNMIGKSGMTISTIAGKGTVKIDGELWAAEAKGSNIEEGEEVTVTGQRGLKLTVIRKSRDSGLNSG
ncbi:NfeD family protein [Chloroflexota bacterium]